MNSLTSTFNIVPNFVKPAVLGIAMRFCSEHGMLPLISAQLEAIELIAERYKFSEADKLAFYNQAINILTKAEPTSQMSNILYKLLLQYVKLYEKESNENIKLLYTLAVQLYSVSQYNQLVELNAYQVLKNVSFFNKNIDRTRSVRINRNLRV